MASTTDEIRGQWANPSDILSLLLLIGGDIVQKATAQLVGYKIRIPGQTSAGLSIAPVAFSFGWVAYAFLSLLSSVGDMKLMPTSDYPATLVNCQNGFARDAKSWALGRLLRDHVTRYPVDARGEDEGGRGESIRIDIFVLDPVVPNPDRDFVWWSGWAILLVQIGLAIVPWVLFGNWGVMMVVLCGNGFAAITCAMPQWTDEKWAGRQLQRDKVTCLTGGNGHHHIMVFIGSRGCWDLESIAAGRSMVLAKTRWILVALAMLWMCLLISVGGLEEHAWYLVAIGGIGMLQNAFAAGASREPGASRFHMRTCSSSSII